MEIHTYGDSHAKFTFANFSSEEKDIPKITTHWLGPITMYRIGRDGYFPDLVRNSIAIFCFGEIDVRCHVLLQREKGRSVNEILTDLVNKYLIALANNKGRSTHLAIMSLPPPSYRDIPHPNADYPFRGTEAERSEWTIIMNKLLKDGCEKQGFYYFDIYTGHADKYGLLYKAYSDDDVHLRNGPFVKIRIIEMVEYFSTKYAISI